MYTMQRYLVTITTLGVLISVVRCGDFTIPKEMFLGAGTSSFQVEGAWNLSGKSESSLDRWAHMEKSGIAGGANADVASDSYHKYKEDVRLLKELGMDVYRFSIAWTRILPSGFNNTINQEGLQYYKNLIKELLDNGIQPLVTIYHWDHPQILEDLGGWANELMVDWFVDYARVIFEELGPMVKMFTTINEITTMARFGFNDALMPPGKRLGSYGAYLTTHNLLKAHAKTYHLYDEEYRPTQKGIIGVGITGMTSYPLDPNDPRDVEAAEISLEFEYGLIMHPVWLGDYPHIVKELVANLSRAEGYSKSFLAEFSPEWIEYVKGSSDYVGLSLYLCHTKTLNPVPNPLSSTFGVVQGPLMNATGTAMAFRKLLKRIQTDYNNPPMIVLETGIETHNVIHDYVRIEFFDATIRAILEAIKLDKCNIIGYCVWTLIDNFEWMDGYLYRYGLYNVDFSDPNRPRTPRSSAIWWKTLIQTRDLDAVQLKDIASVGVTPRHKVPLESSKSHSIHLSPSVLGIVSGIFFAVARQPGAIYLIF